MNGNRCQSAQSAIFGLGILLLAAFSHPSPALIFSQRGRVYDHDQNNIAFTNAWALGHLVGTMHGANGTAIAPYWFLTAGHMRSSNPRVFDCPSGSYLITEMVSLPFGDMMLCRVNEPFPRYSRLLNETLKPGQIVRMYGQSSSHWAKDPVLDQDGLVKGWTLGSEVNRSMRPRWGLGRIEQATVNNFYWKFSAYDPEIGTNCAGTAHMDSGGGVFLGADLAGVLVRGIVARNVQPTPGNHPEDCQRGFIFDTTNLFSCGSAIPLYPFQQGSTSADAVAANLRAIYDIIAPPIRVNAGGPEVEGWSEWSGGYQSVRFGLARPFPARTNQAPAGIYDSAVFVRGTNMLTFPATNILLTERYTLRLHFGAMPFLDKGDAPVNVYINGIERAHAFDPVAAAATPGGPAILEIRDLEPETGSRASITLIGAGSKGIAYLSGAELVMQLRL